MTLMRGTAALAMLLLAGLAGCTESGTPASELGFTYELPEDLRKGAIAFTATVSADRYEWTMGDGVTFLQGASVSHAYGITDGTINVRLKAITGQQELTFARAVVLGSGNNAAPDYALAISEEWTTLSEGLILSMEGATDPDGDALRFQWTCTYEGPVTMLGQAHSEGPPSSFKPAPRGYQKTIMTNEVPVPEIELPSNLCLPDEIGRSDIFTERVHLLRFDQPGQYRLHLWSKDAITPSVSTDFVFLVTQSKPEQNFSATFTGNLTAGNGGTAQDIIDDVLPGTELDRRVHTFTVPTATLATSIDLSHSGTAPLDLVTYDVVRGGGTTQREDLGTGVTEIGSLLPGSYHVIVTMDQGATVDYSVVVRADLDLNPRSSYEFHDVSP